MIPIRLLHLVASLFLTARFTDSVNPRSFIYVQISIRLLCPTIPHVFDICFTVLDNVVFQLLCISCNQPMLKVCSFCLHIL
ncbi:hypothetical protein JOL62DRAFT_587391 [Phyllosticta paracitricarpa]|uniref:Secreted protein n=1 Tax=Phyllosticta paracitricarpa TaxID=2016321 RepID=A0ABR1MTS8_9PEZI